MVCVSIPGRKLGGHRSERSGCGEGCSEDPIHFPRLQNPQGSQIGRKADGERRERGRRRLKKWWLSKLILKFLMGFRMGRDADKSLLEVN
ncbi:hypothetical protein CDAR_243961 [Caerostris darwini]|uniref:Uncharacterized protein n=1 Tax=Caerostris darwini TaxID=1538125 RepID=A0AAV4RVA0_9ARAC|nr:hypothetical protein CDAR_243961 [Caerostris darwini]